jgi:hypothetical protein
MKKASGSKSVKSSSSKKGVGQVGKSGVKPPAGDGSRYHGTAARLGKGGQK